MSSLPSLHSSPLNQGRSIPPGIASITLLLLFIPGNFPFQGLEGHTTAKFRDHVKSLNRVDFLGAGMLLIATILVCAAFEQAGIEFPWNSGFVIALMVISGLLWLAFLGWERKVTNAEGVREPISPWRFYKNRAMLGNLL
jgi:hypothetical protein